MASRPDRETRILDGDKLNFSTSGPEFFTWAESAMNLVIRFWWLCRSPHAALYRFQRNAPFLTWAALSSQS
jgi:hypothetical protein